MYLPRYLATMNINRYVPAHNHGLVNISDSGILEDGTPVEDFGGYIVSENPLPNGDELDQMFFDLVAESEG